MTTHAAIRFKLMSPEFYFQNAQSVALLRAALAGDMAKASQVIAQHANPNEEGPSKGENRLRLLHYAIASNDKPAVRILLKAGADPELDATGNGSAFLFSLTLNDVDMLSLLLDVRPVKSLSKDTLEDLMFESIIQGREECTKLLLQRGVPVDLPDGADYTAFMRAITAQHFDMAEYLLAAGASFNIQTPSGSNPANLVQYMLSRYTPGTATYNQLKRMQQFMIERGIVFPVPDPEQVRASRKR